MHAARQIAELPIKIVSETKQQHFIKLVDKMLLLNKNLKEIGDKKTEHRTEIEEEIKRTDKEFNNLVYGIYGITGAEKKTIEDSLK